MTNQSLTRQATVTRPSTRREFLGTKRMGRPTALRQASAEQGGSRGATAGTGRAGCDARFEVPRSFLSTLKAGFFSWAQTGLETALLAGRTHCGMECLQRLWMSMSGSSTIRP